MGALGHSERKLVPVAPIVMNSSWCASPEATTAVAWIITAIVILYPAMNLAGFCSSAHLPEAKNAGEQQGIRPAI